MDKRTIFLSFFADMIKYEFIDLIYDMFEAE